MKPSPANEFLNALLLWCELKLLIRACAIYSKRKASVREVVAVREVAGTTPVGRERERAAV